MNEFIPVIVAVVSGLSSIVVALITVIVKTRIDQKSAKKKAEEDESIQEKDLGEMVAVQEFVDELRIENMFDRVSICQFHNGGKFLNGRSMKKFSMTYESVAPGIEKLKRKYQNVLVSEFPHLFSGMLKEDFMIIENTNKLYPDLTREMDINGVVQSVKVPIRGLRGDILGFITCHSIQEKNDLVGYHLRKDFVEKANKISGYLLR
jgi:hypothetical protein